MDVIFNKIIEIEKEACKVAEQAVKARELLPEQLEAEYRAIDRRYTEQLDAALQKAQEEENARLNSKLETLAAEHGEQMHRLRAYFAAHADAWKEQIFKTVIE